MKNSGFSITRPVWALAYGLPRAPTTSPRDKAPRWREGSSKQTAARGSTDLGSGDPPATTQTASVDPERPVPTGARSVASKRLIRRALGREAANARIMSKKNKIQRLRTSSNRRLLPPIPPLRANSNRCARACCMRRSQAGESSKIICSARADSM